MPEDSLDMSLDDLVQGGRGGGRGGKGRGAKGNGKSHKFGRGKGKSRGKRSSDDNDKENKAAAPADKDGAKLDMSLEEVIDKDFTGRKGKGKRGKDRDDGKGKGRKGKGKNSWSGGSGGNYYNDDGYSKGRDKGYNDRKGSKGWSKGESWGGKGDRGGYQSSAAPDPRGAVWNQHDDRDDEEDDDDWGGKGRGKSRFGGRRAQEEYDEPRDAGRPRAWSDNNRDRGSWQRIPQDRAPVRERREVGRDREERGGRKVADSRSAPQKRRATDEPEGARGSKSVKVTNIPRDVDVQDIRDAFEAETGKIARCRLDRGTAWIAFQTNAAARKAVDTFDRGELNGQNIGVTLDH